MKQSTYNEPIYIQEIFWDFFEKMIYWIAALRYTTLAMTKVKKI